MEHDTTDFGFSEVPVADKARRVRQVFDSVAPRYDLMNDLMSLGLHRLWKRFAVELAAVQRGEQVLDLAGGTGDLARLLAPRVGPTGRVLLADINGAMLSQGRDRLLDAGIAGNLDYLQADAEHLPFADQSLNCVVIGFGLRNVTDKQAALREMHRVLKPGGRLVVFVPNRLYPFETHGCYWRGRYKFGNIPLVNWLPGGLRRRFCPHVRAYTAAGLRRLWRGHPCRPVTFTQIYPGYDGIARRSPGLGRVFRAITYTLERTPLRIFGLSHFVVLEKTL
jgi:ubiquinone/menaquinone biosynthesis methyltransferase